MVLPRNQQRSERDTPHLVYHRYGRQCLDIREFIQPNTPKIKQLSDFAPDGEAGLHWLWDVVCQHVSYPPWSMIGADRHYQESFMAKGLLAKKPLIRQLSYDFWQFSWETWAEDCRVGDCLSLDTKIICYEKGKYEIKYLGDLKIGDEVLSYNWSLGLYEPKPVTNIIRKPPLPAVNVQLRNGTAFISTLDHHFFQYHKAENGLFRKRLRDIDSAKGSVNKILLAREIPSLNQIGKVKKAQLWLEGVYAAEGWASQARRGSSCLKVQIAGDDPSYKFQIASHLIQLGVPFSMSKRSRHSYFTIHSSSLRDVFLQMGHNAFEKRFVENRSSGSIEQIEMLLDGYAKGDAYLNPVNIPPSHRVRIYATSSDELAFQVRLLHVILGRPLHSWYQTNHQGVGKSPIWRLTENTNSIFNKDVLPGVSKVAIKAMTEVGLREVIDITVKDNHNFVLADSHVIASNCEDTSILLTSLLRNHLPADCVYCTIGEFEGHGHGWVTLVKEGEHYVLESTLDRAKPSLWETRELGAKEQYFPVRRFNDLLYEDLQPSKVLERDMERTLLEALQGFYAGYWPGRVPARKIQLPFLR